MLGYRDYAMSVRLLDDSDAASCFLNLVARKLEEHPRYIVPIMEQLLPAIEFVASHQTEYDADEGIYGNFLEKLDRIRALYAESRGRYRRYP